MKSYLLHELTSLEFECCLEKDPETVVIFCLGSIEQHGNHLPLGTDFLSVKDRALQIAKQTNSIVCYTTIAGYSPQHMGFKGTISLQQETLSSIIFDTILSLSMHGVKKILILNTHTTNSPIIESTILKIREQNKKISIAFTRDFPLSFSLKFSERKYSSYDIHAGRSETSVMLAICPELVDKSFLVKDHRYIPKWLQELLNNENLNDIHKFLIDTVAPIDSRLLSKDGVYGAKKISDSNKYDYINNIHKLINFYVEFIKEWKKINV